MDIRNPEYIVEIARCKSVTRAAQRLYVSQSTLSQYLLRLENELGTPLFTRTKNELISTDAGQMYVQAAQAILNIQQTLFENIAALHNEGSIRLGVSSQWGIQMATEVLPAFREQFPSVTLKIYESHSRQLRAMLLADKLDVAVMAVADTADLVGLPSRPLRQEEIVLVLPAGHAFCAVHPQEETVSPAQLTSELRGVSYVLSDEGSTMRQVEDALFSRMLFRPNVTCELNSNRAALEMVARGMGAAFVPAAYALHAPGVQYYRMDPPLLRDNLLVLKKGLEETPPIRLLEDLVLHYRLFR